MAVQTVSAAPARIALPQCRTRSQATRASSPGPARCIDLRHLRPTAAGGFPAIGPGALDGCRTAPVVTAAQLLLRRYYVTLRADGVYGPRTRAAVLAFQARSGRATTGVLSPSDWRALVAQQDLTIGSRGNPVRAVQVLLNHRSAGSDQIVEDGVLGTGTLMRLQDVQRHAGLRVSRTVDNATFGTLLGR